MPKCFVQSYNRPLPSWCFCNSVLLLCSILCLDRDHAWIAGPLRQSTCGPTALAAPLPQCGIRLTSLNQPSALGLCISLATSPPRPHQTPSLAWIGASVVLGVASHAKYLVFDGRLRRIGPRYAIDMPNDIEIRPRPDLCMPRPYA